MWELNMSWANEVSNNTLASSFHTITPEIHVLLVDHEKESLVAIANMLQMCSYKVTIVELASTALAMLANGGEQFDVVIANIHSPDYQGFRLLETAVNKDIMTILMSTDEDVVLARRALEYGAFLHVKKPVSLELVKYLWQHVVKERLRNAAESTFGDGTDSNGRSIDPEEISLAEENSDVVDDRKNKRKRKAKNQNVLDIDVVNSNNHLGHVKRKVCTEWTQELHAKFIDVVIQLGEGRCYPKDILERMNVPGLTRMQVASHLQKCRNENWRAPEKRRGARGRSQPNANVSAKKDGARRFGMIPRSCRNYEPQPPKNQGRSAILELNSGFGSNASANGRRESSMPQLLTRCKSSAQNGGLQLNLGTLSGISAEGIGIENEKSNGNRKEIPTSVVLEMNSRQPRGQNLSVVYGPTGSARNSQVNSPSRRQTVDDFFEFPDLDYIADNISDLQQGSGTNQAQSQQDYAYNQVCPEQVPMAMDMEVRCLKCDLKAANSGNQKCMLHE